jgi:5-oxoprolinase (ATP-hydrolysing) subunit A
MADAGRIDLNADLGEAYGAWEMGDDEGILAFVTSANVACGFHAGDPGVIDRTVALAARAGVAVGAHPSHHDLRGFGRRTIVADPREVEADVLYQVGAVAAFARSRGVPLVHVKPHGALYNQAVQDEALARAIARGVARAGPALVLVGSATSAVMRRAAEAEGLRFAAEAFADRAYRSDGTLVPRGTAGAVVTDHREAAERAVRIARDRRITAVDGGEVPLEADTLCLHGDTPGAVEHARAVRAALESAGVAVRALLA